MAEHVSETPNVVVSDPKVRVVANVLLGIVGLTLGCVVTADAFSADFDLSRYTVPSMAVYTFLASSFGLAVTTPNVPRA